MVILSATILLMKNTMLFFGKVNMLLMAILKKDKFNGTLIIHIPGEPENSGTLYDMNEKRSRTSSMLYWWWNGQWGFNEDGYWVDENGANRGKCYQLTNDRTRSTQIGRESKILQVQHKVIK